MKVGREKEQENETQKMLARIVRDKAGEGKLSSKKIQS